MQKKGRSAALATKAQRELDIAKVEAKKLSSVVSELQRRLDRLEKLQSNGSGWLQPQVSGSNDSWGPGPGPSRFSGRIEAPQSEPRVLHPWQRPTERPHAPTAQRRGGAG